MNRDDRTTALGLHRFGSEFLKACELLIQQTDSIKILSVKYYLAAHSLELLIKAFLRNNKKSLAELKMLGHNLTKLLCAAEKHEQWDRLKLTAEERTAVEMIAPYYCGKELEYIVAGYKEYPALEYLIELNKRLSAGIKAQILERMR
ncbi:hypothetical protein [Pseudodesulfovibrio indicus]|uniref:hypothetical protein n=1 Tax=Pseudodesulfovibrio indicus TaxID=1716143 RepID=UPI002931CC27|nr:hypothetical protein [Pseudodesulfovibrio indicus]